MINAPTIEAKLRQRFGAVEQVTNGIYRAAERYSGRDYAVRYFDLTDDLVKSAESLQRYQEDLLAGTYFAAQSPSDLRWNHYLYFVTSNERAQDEAFNRAKSTIEEDRAYARKIVITENDIDTLLAKPAHIAQTVPVDVVQQWTAKLDAVGLAYVLDEAVTAPDAARRIRAAQQSQLKKLTTPSTLTPAEQMAAKSFLSRLTITGFRNHPQQRHFDFGRVNLIVGRNGVGKTSLLEAIEFLYCRENRRSGSLLPRTSITGEFVGFDGKLVTSASSTTLEMLRARNSHWYAKTDLKKVSLDESFGKFNFLDTDAAVRLSNNNDSQERIERDVARLVLGSEAERLADKIGRVSDKIDDMLRDDQRTASEHRRRLTEAKTRLATLHKAPQTSDALFVGLCTALEQCGWRQLPTDKQTASDLGSSLQRAITAAQVLAQSPTELQAGDPSKLSVYRSALYQDIEAAANVVRQTKASTLAATASQRNLASLLKQQSALEALSGYVEVGFSAKAAALKESRKQVPLLIGRLASVEAPEDALDDTYELDQPLLSVKSAIEAEAHQLEVHQQETRAALKAVEETLSSVTVLRESLLQTAHELLSKVPDPDHCPVCHTQFAAGQLQLRMSAKAEAAGSVLLAERQRTLEAVERELFQARKLLAAVDRLISFAGDHTKITARGAIEAVADCRRSLELERLMLRQCEEELRQLEANGLTPFGLKNLLGDAGLDRPPTREELPKLVRAISEVIEQESGALSTANSELQASRGRHEEIASRNNVALDVTPEKLMESLRQRLASMDAALSAAETLDAVLDHRHSASIPLVARLDQARGQLDNLTTAIQREIMSLASVQAEERTASELEVKLKDLETEQQRMRVAQGLLAELFNQATSGFFAKQVLAENAAAIADVFAAIHAPNEFLIQTGSDVGLKIIRRETNNEVQLAEMSTGQRAAYALSLFLAMNLRLNMGPPVVLLDDPIAHVDDLNVLSFLDHLRDLAVGGSRQIFLATADAKLAGLFRQKFRFLGKEEFREIELMRS